MRRILSQLEEREWRQSLRFIRVRALAALFVLLFAFTSIVIRSYVLQLGNDSRLQKWAEQQYHKKIILSPERGTIFDRNGHELAIDIQVFSIFAHPHLIPADQRESVAAELAKVLADSRRAISKKLASEKRFVWIERRVSVETKKAIEAKKLTGVYFVPEKKRYYPNGALAGQLLGAVGYDSVALGGIELLYDKFLKSKQENFLFERDARGRSYLYVGEERKDFADIHLSIDRNIQYIAERELEKAMVNFHAKHGFVIVAQPQSGEILAVANAPAFDPNRYTEFPISEWRNHAFLDVFEPGSTFKAVTAAAALREGKVNPNAKFNCEEGRWRVASRTIEDSHAHGVLSFAEIIQVSSNIGTAKIGQKIGKKAFFNMIENLGFGKRSFLAFPGESPGVMSTPEKWGALEEATIAFGQGIAVTGLQMIQAYGAFGNNGWLMRPILVRSVVNRNHELVFREEQTPLRQVMSEKESRQLTAMLEKVVQPGGTARQAALENFDVAGKTGTAQKVIDGVYADGKYVSSFIGYVPSEGPELLIYAVLDEPKPQYYGGTVAGPMFRQIADQALNHLGIMGKREHDRVAVAETPRAGQAERALPVPEDRVLSHDHEEGAEGILVTSLEKGVVPNLSGLSLRQVLQPFNESPYRVESQGVGFVVKQSPSPGAVLKEGEVVQIVLMPKRS